MTRPTRLLALVALLALAGTSAAFGFWSTAGTGAGTASVGTLAAPTNVVATRSGADVGITWTAVAGVDGYLVSRVNAGNATAACGGALVTASSCVDSSVPAGQYTYLVTAVLRSWTAVSGPSGSVTVPAGDNTPPTVASINRASTKTATNAGPLTWTVTFSEAVTGVVPARFGFAATGITPAPSTNSLTVSQGSSGATWNVSLATNGLSGTNAGSIALTLASATGIVDGAGNGLGGSLPVTGEAYGFDTTRPTVSTITRAAVSPTSADSVSWTVAFAEPVSGVGADDFTLSATGVTGSPAITGVTGSGSTYTVAASTGAGDGSLRLDVPNNGVSITDAAGNALNAAYSSGEAYVVDRGPLVTITKIGTVQRSPRQISVEGDYGKATGDLASVTIYVCKANAFPCAGANIAATLTGTLKPQTSTWSASSADLAAGTYYLRAEQSDSTDHVGYSNVATITLT